MSNNSKKYYFLVSSIILLILIAIGIFLFPAKKSEKKIEITLAMIEQNNIGIGYMEKFDYNQAVIEFQKLVDQYPKWNLAKINLAIAILNAEGDSEQKKSSDVAIEICQEVLQSEPNNPYAHYIIGFLKYNGNEIPEAYPHFEKVLEIDPNDAFSWYFKGVSHPKGPDSKEALDCFLKAIEIDPYLNVARFGILSNHPDYVDEKNLRQKWTELTQKLNDNMWETYYKVRYYDIGPYGRVQGILPMTPSPGKIGPLPLFEKRPIKIQLRSGSRWAKTSDLGSDINGDILRALKERFGRTIVLFDYNRDDRIDILLLNAVVENNQLRHLLLRNDGNNQFTDVTTEANLNLHRLGTGALAGDFDNDGYTDLVITGIQEQKLFRNNRKGGFEDVSKLAGLNEVKGICLGATFADLDQDTDLDLVIAEYAQSADAALAGLKGHRPPSGKMLTFINTGEALPVPQSRKELSFAKENTGNPFDINRLVAPLTCSFKLENKDPSLAPLGAMMTITAADLDFDKDIDLLCFPDQGKTKGIINDRLLRFHTSENLPLTQFGSTGAIVLDANHDERSDLFVIHSHEKPELYLSKEGFVGKDLSRGFRKGLTNSPVLLQAQSLDLDLDSWTDIVGLSKNGEAILLQNDGQGKLIQQMNPFGIDLPKNIQAVRVADFDGDYQNDLLIWTEENGLEIRYNLGNGHNAIRLILYGKNPYYPPAEVRSNLEGFGSWVVVHAKDLWAGQEYTTLSAGLGQSLLPLDFGIGTHSQAETIRIRWPDLIPQAEINYPARKTLHVVEWNRKPTSCPTIFGWDGEKYLFITDTLGAGSVGETGPDGNCRPPRPEETVALGKNILQPKNGFYSIKIAEPMDEVMYLDRVQLVIVDHPSETEVLPDERFVFSDPWPSQKLWLMNNPIFPTKVIDHRGKDQTKTLRYRDHVFVNDFAHRTWMGFAERHWLELDFGQQLNYLSSDQDFAICLAGWTDYAFPETIFAAHQANIHMEPAILEAQLTDGTWKKIAELGLPAGFPRMMTRNLKGLLPKNCSKLRIQTNLQIYWDQIYLARIQDTIPEIPPNRLDKKSENNKLTSTKTFILEPEKSTLQSRGLLQEISRGKGHPVTYDDNRTEMVPVTPWRGRFTRLGDVTPLLQKTDDHFVVAGPGDEVTLQFSAENIPPLPQGFVRSFILKSWGYCKDSDSFTKGFGEVYPLPYRAMKEYPPTKPNPDRSQIEYDRLWNTRPGAGGS